MTSASGQLAEPTPGHKRVLIAAGLPDLTLNGLRRSFGTLSEWLECPAGVVAQIMGHKPSAIAEKHYRRRPLDLLRLWHTKIEGWMLEQVGIDFVPTAQGLRIVNNGWSLMRVALRATILHDQDTPAQGLESLFRDGERGRHSIRSCAATGCHAAPPERSIKRHRNERTGLGPAPTAGAVN
jgi:hypothetical protein